MHKLQLLGSDKRLRAIQQKVSPREFPFAEFLEQRLGEKVAAKLSKGIAMPTAMARFRCVRLVGTFDIPYWRPH